MELKASRCLLHCMRATIDCCFRIVCILKICHISKCPVSILAALILHHLENSSLSLNSRLKNRKRLGLLDKCIYMHQCSVYIKRRYIILSLRGKGD